MPNGVTVYGDKPTRDALAKVVNRYPDLWEERPGFAKIRPGEELTIPLKDGWQKEVNLSTKVYPLSARDKAEVDKTFGKLHEQGKMDWTRKHTAFGYPVFVAWKKIWKDGAWTDKPRVVIDICGLIGVTSRC